MTPLSIEDHAKMRQAHKSNVCLCDEYSLLVLIQAEEIKRLKAENDLLKREVFDADTL